MAHQQTTNESSDGWPSSEGRWRPLCPDAHWVAGLAERPPEGTEEGRVPGDSEPNLSPLVNLSACQYREGTLGLTAGHFSVSDRTLARPGRNKCVPLSKHLSTTLSSALISQTLLLSKCDTDRSLHVHKQLLPMACCF
ncbi:hypothetical protein DPX16_16883 [Anabarilius grahami]|uniref:Uncharacterized protein n=1 Tax=Anabarilius grahami TaxID=495550 RepID=A0A3N0YM62_ANAGA|nr:hypothetical protein DPX16_16883 [Anabarilius grahami]